MSIRRNSITEITIRAGIAIFIFISRRNRTVLKSRILITKTVIRFNSRSPSEGSKVEYA
jgi:hypothetical protein